MSRLFPNWDQIPTLTQKLTPGEERLTRYLDDHLPDEWEIYVQPFLNGDRPDCVLLHPHKGIVIIEVKDWNPKHYHSTKRQASRRTSASRSNRMMVSDNRGSYEIRSPLDQVSQYRNNLLNIYSPWLGDAVDEDPTLFAGFRVAVYFSTMDSQQALDMLGEKPENISIWGTDTLNNNGLVDDLQSLHWPSINRFPKTWVDSVRFWLRPPVHSLEQGIPIKLTKDQKRHVDVSPDLHHRVRGVAGSGKTMVLAYRAANIAAEGAKVLIATYNITLSHYIRDILKRIPQRFHWENIEIQHFHGLCFNFLNENGINASAHSHGIDKDTYLDDVVPSLVSETLAAGRNDNNRQYDAVLIDEAQDYYRHWYDLLCKFLSEHNELLLVTDERQNIYQRDQSWIDDPMLGTQFRGRWGTIKDSYRLPPKIMEAANTFASSFFDEPGEPCVPPSDNMEIFDEHMIWREVESFEEAVAKAVAAVQWLNTKKNVHPQDIVVITSSHKEGLKLVTAFEECGYKANHVFEEEDSEDRTRHKRSFWMGDGRLKLCTIHSFKGWELKNVILITPEKESSEFSDVDRLVYTAMTRTRENLIVFNRHPRYAGFGLEWPSDW
ncbi:UvrD-helicase domain-containing protein [Gemmatimonadota bacterium]